jgi:hypothetical protein
MNINIQNELVGDLSALSGIVEDPISMDGNWFNAKISGTDLTLSIKVFAEESHFGIGGGRISKLAIYDDQLRLELMNFHASCETHYDRGWDIKPKTQEAYDRCKQIVEALGGQMDIKPKRKYHV